MKLKRMVSVVCCVAMLLSLNIVWAAEDISANDSTELSINSSGFIEDWSKVKYITVDEYIEKYGGERVVNEAFGRGEINNKSMLLKAEGKVNEAKILLSENDSVTNETTDLMLSLKEGKFLGLEIESISDLPPDNINLSIRVKGNEFSNGIENKDKTLSIKQNKNELTSTTANNKYNGYNKDGTPYNILYTDNFPNLADIDSYVYEPNSGSYFYKYGYSWVGDYRITTEVTFKDTKLYAGTQSVNMYVFVGATTDNATGKSIDFGLMANPHVSNRNKGLYGVRNINKGQGVKVWDVDAYPKVNIVGETTNPMTLEEKTVRLELVIDQNGEVGATMYIGNNLVYYKSEIIDNFKSGNDRTLTFFQSMSCIEANSEYTTPNNGAYFRNVKYSNTKLQNYNDVSAHSFGTFGDYTYYVYICKPSGISYTPGSNTETVSIEYN